MRAKIRELSKDFDEHKLPPYGVVFDLQVIESLETVPFAYRL